MKMAAASAQEIHVANAVNEKIKRSVKIAVLY